jgi:predicted AlkP superfamily pyrophosphatase or phosphodiesterase
MVRMRLLWLMLGSIALAATAMWLLPAGAPSQEKKRPKLAVILVFDQLRGDYPERWRELFGPGGFRRLQDEGASFTNCHYPYAYTITAPGHASLVTGCSPDKHGIVGNEWFDRASRESITAVTPPAEQAHLGLGPYRRRQESVGDVLLRLLRDKARIFSFSIKERAAILLAALRAQACYWFDNKTGRFVTSRYYRHEPHAWVNAFNRQKPADRWRGTVWERLRPDLDYVKHSGPDDVACEGTGVFQGQTFPHPFFARELSQTYYDGMLNSPRGNQLLLELVRAAVAAEKIGQTDTTDLLCISFSSNDLVGHCWGPDSQEVLDMTLCTDEVIKGLLDLLDAQVGKGNYIVTLSADHGVGSLPELAAAEGKDAGRVPAELLTSRAEETLNEALLGPGQKAPWLESPRKSNSWVYLNQATLREHGIAPARAERVLAEWLAAQPGIEAALTRTQLMSAEPLGSLADKVRLSFRPEACGDVMVILKPYHLFSPSVPPRDPKNVPYRASHGSPHPYDTHVPLFAFGPDVVPGKRAELVTPQALASIVAHALELPPPAAAEAQLPAGLFRR